VTVASGARPRRRLLFVAPWFLFPSDSGGKIRTRDILQGMKGGSFEITLASPAPLDHDRWAAELSEISDRFVHWPEPARTGSKSRFRMLQLLAPLPLSVLSDRSPSARQLVAEELDRSPDVAVIDFAHTAIIFPQQTSVPTVLFTHNVEAEIFERHASIEKNVVKKWVWRSQARKMVEFESRALDRQDAVIAVSERDKEILEQRYGIANGKAIPTGVAVERFRYTPPSAGRGQKLVFTGSMDWAPNVDGVAYFMDRIWPQIAEARAGVQFTVVGRNPPKQLISDAKRRGLPWRFTGFVDDVRPHISDCDVYIIPLRVGSGTRIKAFEAMALGCPVVSTSIGIEGLELTSEEHCLIADTPETFAKAVIRMLDDGGLRADLSHKAREYVVERFSAERVAREFEEICLRMCSTATSA